LDLNFSDSFLKKCLVSKPFWIEITIWKTNQKDLNSCQVKNLKVYDMKKKTVKYKLLKIKIHSFTLPSNRVIRELGLE
jgi:hypothetical protein